MPDNELLFRGEITQRDEHYRWLNQELARYTYKPGWSLQIVPRDVWGAQLQIEAQVVDSRQPIGDEAWHRRPLTLKTVKIVFKTAMDVPFGNSAVFAWKLQQAILEMEQHESREWLRRDGEIYDDPHKEIVARGMIVND